MNSLIEKSGYRRPPRIIRYITVATISLIAATAFIVVTPLALSAIGKLGPGDWAQLSNEGQAYGGIASVFGILALAGVAVSVVLQSRETALGRAQALRTAHSDLFFKAIDDPDLLACWSPFLQGNFEQERQQVYTNLIVSFWYSMFEIGSLRDDQVRYLAAEMFKTEPGRRYWSVSGPVRLSLPTTSKELKFAKIMNDQYMRKTPESEFSEEESLLTKHYDRSAINALMLGLAGGILAVGGAAALKSSYKAIICRVR
jgi:hypothetical protein